MDIKRMRKAELIELNGQLNEAREHCDAVIEALRAELAAARAEIEALRVAAAQSEAPRAQAERPAATGSAQAHRVSHSVVRNNKLVHEFDPRCAGQLSQRNASLPRTRRLGAEGTAMKRTPSQILYDMESPGERWARRVVLSLLVAAVVMVLFV